MRKNRSFYYLNFWLKIKLSSLPFPDTSLIHPSEMLFQSNTIRVKRNFQSYFSRIFIVRNPLIFRNIKNSNHVWFLHCNSLNRFSPIVNKQHFSWRFLFVSDSTSYFRQNVFRSQRIKNKYKWKLPVVNEHLLL